MNQFLRRVMLAFGFAALADWNRRISPLSGVWHII